MTLKVTSILCKFERYVDAFNTNVKHNCSCCARFFRSKKQWISSFTKISSYVSWIGFTDFLDFTAYLANQQKHLLASFEIKKLLKYSAVTIKANLNHRSWLLYLIHLFVCFSLSLHVWLHVIKYSWSFMSSCWATLSHTKHHWAKLLRTTSTKETHHPNSSFSIIFVPLETMYFQIKTEIILFFSKQ